MKTLKLAANVFLDFILKIMFVLQKLIAQRIQVTYKYKGTGSIYIIINPLTPDARQTGNFQVSGFILRDREICFANFTIFKL